jgi:hypothetical protein
MSPDGKNVLRLLAGPDDLVVDAGHARAGEAAEADLNPFVAPVRPGSWATDPDPRRHMTAEHARRGDDLKFRADPRDGLLTLDAGIGIGRRSADGKRAWGPE